ncbi:MAG: hypothetical protein LBU34_01150, partial [Planctomycetaceae bacterium]|nr:hypothetical protein [Planctomycetaceae bacterium]
PAKIRSDTTVTESNIHYPTDSNLLWDVYRTISRLVEHASDQEEVLRNCLFYLTTEYTEHTEISKLIRSQVYFLRIQNEDNNKKTFYVLFPINKRKLKLYVNIIITTSVYFVYSVVNK